MAEDPSRFAIACRQTGPITLPEKLPKEENVFSESTSLLFKNTKVIRMFDAKRNTLIYILAHPSREAAKKNWEEFGNDPEWKRVREESEANGKIVSKVESVFMEATDYSPVK